MPPQPPNQHAGVALEELTIVAASPLPDGSEAWPIRAVRLTTPEQPLPEGAYVVCGRSDDVEQLLRSPLCRPIYVVSNSTSGSLAGHDNVTADGLADGEWETAVGAICSKHLATIPQMIVGHACARPDAAAVCDVSGEWTYAELVARAWNLGAALGEQGLQEGVTVGVLLSPRRLMTATLLGLGLRRMVPCNLSTFHAQRALQLERMATQPCGSAAILTDSDAADVAAGSGLRVIRVDQLEIEAAVEPQSVRAAYDELASSSDALTDVRAPSIRRLASPWGTARASRTVYASRAVALHSPAPQPRL